MKGRLWFILILLSFLGSPILVWAQEPPEIVIPAAILLDGQTGEIHYGKNEHERRSIASTVKIMTILLVAEEIQARKMKLSDVVTASANAASREGTQIRLRAGDKFTVEELLYATALVSANDAAVALAEHLAGSEREFARLMTERARSLGLKNTAFVDATGLLPASSGNYSTAYDLAQLMRYAMGNPIFARIVGTKEYDLKAQGRTIRNSNDLLFTFPGADGGKTGVTTPAGHTLVASASQGGWRLIVVVLGPKSREQRFEQAQALFEWGFAHLETILRQGEEVTQIPVREGARSQVTLVPRTDVKTILVGERRPNLSRRLDVPKAVDAPIRQGDALGELIILKDDVEVGRVDLVAKGNVGRANIFSYLLQWLLDLLGIG
ncbi:MAG: D-alanyl-D-alanine carboxypeptidase family protein [Limnochordia bacterium]